MDKITYDLFVSMLYLKQAIENGYATGPRIVPAGYALGATGGHCDSTFLPPSLEKAGKEEGIADIDAGRFKTFESKQGLRDHMQGIAAKVRTVQ